MHPAVYPPQQVPPPSAAHFAAMPYPGPQPSHQYLPIVSHASALAPGAPHHQSFSHSSHASSTSGHTIDPLVPAASPVSGQQHQNQHQHLIQEHQLHLHQQQQQPEQQHQQLHHQQQQIFYPPHHQMSGMNRESPALPFLYTSPYVMSAHLPHQRTEPIFISAQHTPLPQTQTSEPVTSQLLQKQNPLISSVSPKVGHDITSKTPLRDDGTDQDLGYSEGEE